MNDVFARLDAATADLSAPLAAGDEVALTANRADLRRRAAGLPVRVASKSVRVREVLRHTLDQDGFTGLMTYSLAESLWLAGHGFDDLLMAYPTVDRASLEALGADEAAAAAITLMVDSVEGVDYLARALGRSHAPIRLAIDVDASLRIGPAHLGVRRSPVRTPSEAATLAAYIADQNGFDLVGVMFYEAQIAGLPDSSPAIRWVKSRSAAELRERRRAVVEAVGERATLRIVNGGGTGSLHVTGTDPVVTELTAGSGLFQSHLFDGYEGVERAPAAYFALPVVRKPADDIATCFGGGYIGSGPAQDSRLPRPVWPEGLKLLGTEGAGEVQTPVKGPAARALRIGDRVWMRASKAGEPLERFDELHLVDAAGRRTTVPTYRGEGKDFG